MFEPLTIPKGDDVHALPDLLSQPVKHKVIVPSAEAAYYFRMNMISSKPDWLEFGQSPVNRSLWDLIKMVLNNERCRGEAGLHSRVVAALRIINCYDEMCLRRDDVTSTTPSPRPDACLDVEGYPPLVIVEEEDAPSHGGQATKNALQSKLWRVPEYRLLPFVGVGTHKMELYEKGKTLNACDFQIFAKMENENQQNCPSASRAARWRAAMSGIFF